MGFSARNRGLILLNAFLVINVFVTTTIMYSLGSTTTACLPPLASPLDTKKEPSQSTFRAPVVESTVPPVHSPWRRTFHAPVVVYTVPPPVRPSPRSMLSIVITGGAGFIGSQLGYYPHRMGHKVTLIDNMVFGYEDNLVVDGQRFGRFIRGDVLDSRIWPFFVGADVLFHFAALTALPVCQSHPLEAMKVNVGGVAAVLEGARQTGVRRFILASTSAVYENNDIRQHSRDGFTEDLPVSPHLLYSLSKSQAEQLTSAFAASYHMEVVVLRFFNVYGPHQDFRRKSPPFTSYIVRELIRGRTPVLHGDGTQRRDYIHVHDLICLAVLAMEHPAAVNQTFNVASGVTYSVNEVYAIVSSIVRTSIRPHRRNALHFWNAYPELFQGNRTLRLDVLEREVQKNNLGSYARAWQLLGWAPKMSMRLGLRGLVRYVRLQLNSAKFGNRSLTSRGL